MKIAMALMLGVALTGCQADQDANPPSSATTLAGTVLYRERAALPADATIEVRLEDVSLADAPAEVIAIQTITAGGRQVPIPFELTYSPQRIESNRRYGVRATIRNAGGELLYTTTTHNAVFAQGAAPGNLELVVERVGGSAPAPAESTGSITGAPWRLVSIARAGAAAEPVPSDPPYTLEFGADGRYGGQAHCNRYTGGYERPAPDRIALRGGAATLAACPLPSIADEFLRDLATATRYVVRGAELELSAESGSTLTFTREPPQAAAPAVGRTFVFECATGESFTVRGGPGEVALWAPASVGGQYVVLGLTRDAAGARYADGDTVFWNKGELATFEIGGRRFEDCRSNPSAAPWADARRRGATFRALGNEPSWVLEVFAERLALVTDYGENRMELSYAAPVVDGNRTTYRALDGDRELTAVITRGGCTDTMSGEAFEVTAAVTLGSQTFYGCGRFL